MAMVFSMWPKLKVSDLLIVKDQYGNVYWPEYGLDNIGNLEPNKGYQIKMNASMPKHFKLMEIIHSLFS